MRKVPDRLEPPNRPTDFNHQEYRRLRMLNAQLEQAGQWIDRRSREMVTAYALAAAQARHTERRDEDVELVATILFLLREDHPDFLLGSNNIVTRIDIPILPATSTDRDSRHTRVQKELASVSGRGEWCQLFLNLYERALRRDAVKLLSIGMLCTDVALIQQQLRSW